METRRLPKFESEADEARWWYENREELAKDMINATREGRSGPGVVERLRMKRTKAEAASQTVSEKSSHAA